jgi:nicotinamide-nucleotide amidase
MSVAAAAKRVAGLLKTRRVKVVFAESCTGGLVSGAMTAVPGISDFHCGGVVVYRNETKMAYLGIPADVLKKPGPVSSDVAELMATRILEKTPEADVAVSVTGHLGPNAPARLDGRIYAAVAWREKSGSSAGSRPKSWRFQCDKADSRLQRQRWVVEQVLELLGRELEST